MEFIARMVDQDMPANQGEDLTASSDGSDMTGLAIRKLSLFSYRNYTHLRMEAEGLKQDSNIVVITGHNGAGKTNILEAISMLTPGRGLRSCKTRDLDQVNAFGPWAVSCSLDSQYGPVELGTGRDPEGERRIVRINGATAKGQSALSEYISAVWLTPQMDRLFLDSSGARRRFLDRLIYGFDAAHAGRLSAYEKAMRERAKLLKQGVKDDIWLKALESQMVERGIAVAAARRDMTERLDIACARSDGPFPGAKVTVSGSVEDDLARLPAVEVEDKFAAALRAGRQQDADNGGAGHGPHRSDLDVMHLEKNMPAHLCSTGEQKALLIAIVLAHAKLQAAERGVPPLLLLDEVAAHLDQKKRSALFETIESLGSQTWLTGTEPNVFDELKGKAQFFHVENGKVKKQAA
ncbi:DNA replication/repair protein RecF [Curvivirga aplysinae]|uniref:DNA replication/repair protein RecF n=1 Tax=Curvivirga aplysinae TaxID=2529852 RepID=UPI001F22745D|nr:DNA replication/repair protein RecF [Curvivirga aplysinae]